MLTYWLLAADYSQNREVLQRAQDTPLSAINRPAWFRQTEDGK